MLALVSQHHSHRTGTELRAEFARRLAQNGSIRFGSWSVRKSRGGSVAQSLYNLSDEQMECELRDRLSFMRCLRALA